MLIRRIESYTTANVQLDLSSTSAYLQSFRNATWSACSFNIAGTLVATLVVTLVYVLIFVGFSMKWKARIDLDYFPLSRCHKQIQSFSLKEYFCALRANKWIPCAPGQWQWLLLAEVFPQARVHLWFTWQNQKMQESSHKLLPGVYNKLFVATLIFYLKLCVVWYWSRINLFKRDILISNQLSWYSNRLAFLLADSVFNVHLQLESTILKEADTFPYLKISTEADIASDFIFNVLAKSAKLFLLWLPQTILLNH